MYRLSGSVWEWENEPPSSNKTGSQKSTYFNPIFMGDISKY